MAAVSSVGTKLGYKTLEATATYTDVPYLQAVPELGAAPEQIDVTTLIDTIKKTVPGTMDLGDLSFEFIYDKTTFQAVKALTGTIFWQVQFSDNTKFSFTAIPTVVMGSAAVNGALSYKISMSLQSAMAVTFV